MARKKKSSSESALRAAGSGTPSGGSRIWFAFVGLLVALIATGALVVWHRSKDPIRQQVRTWDQLHHDRVDQRIDRCFGGSTGNAIRAIVPDIRRGTFPRPFHDCAGMRFVDVMASPVAFIGDLSNPPAAAEPAQARERVRLQRLSSTLAHIERITIPLDRNQPIPEASREALATSLEDLANDLDQEHQSFGALLMSAEGAASWW